jgi:hypothetical protein
VALLQIEFPVGFRRGAGNILGKVDEIGGGGVPNVKEGLMPSAARF